MSYKSQIEQELLRRGWDIVEIREGQDWWDDENWKVDLKHNPKKTFYLYFIVDPMFEGIREKGQAIYEVKAVAERLESWNDDTNTITKIEMSKGRFDVKLGEFINILDQYKNGNT